MVTLPLAKILIAVLAGALAYAWGALAEEHIKSQRWRIVSFSLVIVFAIGIGIYLFYF